MLPAYLVWYILAIFHEVALGGPVLVGHYITCVPIVWLRAEISSPEITGTT